jgi:hypothetical protein
MSSVARTLALWVRIPLHAWMFAFILCLCVGGGLAHDEAQWSDYVMTEIDAQSASVCRSVSFTGNALDLYSRGARFESRPEH